MELSPQTQRLVVTSGKTVAFIPALPNGSTTHSLTLPYSPSSASIHPIMQDRFVTGNSGDEWVRVHGMDGEEREVLKGHHGPVHCVEFSPDGEMYASGSGGCSHYLFHYWPLTSHDALSLPPPEDGQCFQSMQSLWNPHLLFAGTIRLWQTTPGKTYGLWQGQTNGGYEWLLCV